MEAIFKSCREGKDAMGVVESQGGDRDKINPLILLLLLNNNRIESFKKPYFH